jgi:hypothetical protein
VTTCPLCNADAEKRPAPPGSSYFSCSNGHRFTATPLTINAWRRLRDQKPDVWQATRDLLVELIEHHDMGFDEENWSDAVKSWSVERKQEKESLGSHLSSCGKRLLFYDTRTVPHESDTDTRPRDRLYICRDCGELWCELRQTGEWIREIPGSVESVE